jgi:hypothetical protein
MEKKRPPAVTATKRFTRLSIYGRRSPLNNSTETLP